MNRVSKTRKIYFYRLAGRCVILLLAAYFLLRGSDDFEILAGWQFFRRFSLLHILWIIWMIDMFQQLIPAKGYISLGSQKHFLVRFRPIAEKINYQALKEYVTGITRSAYIVFGLWVGILAVIAALYFTGVLGRNGVFFLVVLFYVCDLICVLIWCPFRLIMKNRCCTTCRIFNWDHLMMFSPFLLTPSFFTTTLLLASFAVWVVWELCVMLYPERFWENTNQALRCSECTDKLCTQYCQKIRRS